MRSTRAPGRRHGIVLLSSAAVVGLATMPAMAQERSAAATQQAADPGPDLDQGQIEDIIVTARRRAESAQDTPLSISAISSDQLQQLNIVRIEGITQLAPSLRVTQASGSGNAPAIYIRGIGTLSTALYVEPAVGIYVDGVYTPRPSGNTFDLPDISSVEVLRGPQGTLFGRNTTGGAILLSTRNPTPEFGMKADFSYGSYNELIASSVVQLGRLGNSPFMAKVSAQVHSRDGWVEAPGYSPAKWGGALDSFGVGGAIRGEMGDFTLDLRGRYNDLISYTGWEALAGTAVGKAYFGNAGVANNRPFPIGVGPRDYSYRDPRSDAKSQVKTWGGVLTAQYDFSAAFQVKSITGYNNIDQNLRGNIGGGSTLGIVANPAVPGQFVESVTPHVTPNNPGTQKQFTQELQLLGDVGDFNYLLGLYYYDEKVDETITTILNSPLSATTAIRLNRSTSYSIDSTSLAGFAQIGWKPSFAGGRLELVGGIRYTEDKKTLSSRSVSTTTTTTILTQARKDKWDNVGWMGSISYQLVPGVLVYGRGASAYRSGGYNAPTVGAPPFGPETARSYELGVKSDLFDRHVRFNAAVYQTDYDDLQVNGYNIATNTNQLTNAGKARYRGFEVEAQAGLGGFRIDGNVGYVDPQYSEYIIAVAGKPTNVADQAAFANVPNWTYHAGAQYALETASAGKFTLRGDFTGKGNAPTYSLISQAPNTAQVPLYGVESNVSLRLLWNGTIQGRKMRAQIFAENLTDNRFLTFATDFGAIMSGVYNRPRYYGASIGIDF
ncbi:TonB-dependent receptor [Sphingomonas hengshuiensis]|uniref:TonB-dependent receptor n=1 Tax=Sphingomonas hengshuiensis TaxID=1609977 RepID=UPI00098264A4|nr:TonB-dependent receptor [Sphingomonas hengshuiensis]